MLGRLLLRGGVPPWLTRRPAQFVRAFQECAALSPPLHHGLIISGPAAAVMLDCASRGAEADWVSELAPGAWLCYLNGGRRRCLEGLKYIRAPFDGSVVQRWGFELADRETACLDTLESILPRSEPMAERFLDLCLQRRWLNAEGIARRLAERESRGREGGRASHRLRHLRWAARKASIGTHSTAERRMARVLGDNGFRRGGATGWRANHEVRGVDALGNAWTIRPDFCWPAQRVAVEVDGKAHHSDEAAFERDRLRWRRLVEAGWTVIPVTWGVLESGADQVVAELRAHLQARGR